MSKDSYDSRCYELAEYFLDGEQHATKDHLSALAQEIQETVESFISDLHRSGENIGPPA